MRAATRIANSALPDEAELLQATLDQMPSGVATLDGNNNILTSNARFFDMLNRAGLIASPFAALPHKELASHALTDIAPAIMDQPEEVAGASGRRFVFTYIDAVDGTGGGTILISDVTAQHISAEAVQSALAQKDSIEQAKTAFVSQVAHHFRTPLNVILGYVGIMTSQGDRIDPTTQTTYLDFIRESASALLLNMNEMMDIIRLQRNEQDVELENRELSALFIDAISEIEPVLQAEAALLEADEMIDTIGSTAVVMDVRLVRRAITGLLRTCAVLGGQGSVLKLSAERSVDGTVLTVALDFVAGRTDAASIIDSIEKGEPVKEISLTGNASGYGIVLAAVLLRLCQVKVSARACDGRAICVELGFRVASST